jgi:hypothetical protein
MADQHPRGQKQIAVSSDQFCAEEHLSVAVDPGRVVSGASSGEQRRPICNRREALQEAADLISALPA